MVDADGNPVLPSQAAEQLGIQVVRNPLRLPGQGASMSTYSATTVTEPGAQHSVGVDASANLVKGSYDQQLHGGSVAAAGRIGADVNAGATAGVNAAGQLNAAVHGNAFVGGQASGHVQAGNFKLQGDLKAGAHADGMASLTYDPKAGALLPHFSGQAGVGVGVEGSLDATHDGRYVSAHVGLKGRHGVGVGTQRNGISMNHRLDIHGNVIAQDVKQAADNKAASVASNIPEAERYMSPDGHTPVPLSVARNAQAASASQAPTQAKFLELNNEAETETETDAEAEADSEMQSESDAEMEMEMESDMDMDMDSDSESESESEWEFD